MKKGIIKESEKETKVDVVKIIRKAIDKIERGREKAYILQQLFDNEAGAVNENISLDHIVLLFSGAETLLKEIVAGNEEASDDLMNLSDSETLKMEVTA